MDFREKEREIKKTLEARKIKPSKEVWEKLDNHLDQKERKPYRYLYRIGIAASLLTLLGIASFYYSGSYNNEVEKIVVEEVDSFDQKEIIIDRSEKLIKNSGEVVKTTNNESKEVKPNTSSKEKVDFKLPPSKVKTEKYLAEISKTDKVENVEEANTKEEEFISEEVQNTIIANGETLDSNFENVQLSPEEEAGKLLAEAFVFNSKHNQKNTEDIVDAMDLLMEINEDIETEINPKLRKQLEYLLIDGWFKAKTALASNK